MGLAHSSSCETAFPLWQLNAPCVCVPVLLAKMCSGSLFRWWYKRFASPGTADWPGAHQTHFRLGFLPPGQRRKFTDHTSALVHTFYFSSLTWPTKIWVWEITFSCGCLCWLTTYFRVQGSSIIFLPPLCADQSAAADRHGESFASISKERRPLLLSSFCVCRPTCYNYWKGNIFWSLLFLLRKKNTASALSDIFLSLFTRDVPIFRVLLYTNYNHWWYEAPSVSGYDGTHATDW